MTITAHKTRSRQRTEVSNAQAQPGLGVRPGPVSDPETAGQVCATVDTRAHAPADASLAQQRADALVAVTTGGVETRTPAGKQAGPGVQGRPVAMTVSAS